MARPIMPTPVLKGDNAKIFLDELDKTKLTPKVHQKLKECEVLYHNFLKKIEPNENHSL